VIIWVLRGRAETVSLVREFAKIGVPACSPLSVLEVLIGARPEEQESTRELLGSFQTIPVDFAIGELAARYVRDHQDRGRPDFVDAVIAATAVVHDLVLVTYNRRHFPMPEIRLLSPPGL